MEVYIPPDDKKDEDVWIADLAETREQTGEGYKMQRLANINRTIREKKAKAVSVVRDTLDAILKQVA